MAKAVVEQDTQVTRRGGGNVGSAYGSSGGGGKRSSVRASVRSVYAGDEERKLMSGGSGGATEAEGKRRTGVWGEGRWI